MIKKGRFKSIIVLFTGDITMSFFTVFVFFVFTFCLIKIKKKRNYYKRKKIKYTIIQLFAFRLMSRIGGAMVSVLGSSAVNRGFE
jgi:heme/copper-type cytochrome/quinol oxidase subunit 2